jgi:hypothetical protein
VRLWRHERSARLRASLRATIAGARERLRARWPRIRRASLRLLRQGAAIGALALAVLVGGRFALHAVEPGQVGLRYSKWGGGGVAAQDFGPGLHLSLPGLHKWHDLPVGTDLMTWRSGEGEDPGRQLDVRTVDGGSVALDLCIPFRIRQGAAHLIVAEGNRGTYRELARAKAEPVLLDAFGRFASEELSDSAARRAVLERALVELNASLEAIHLVAGEILVEEVRFAEAYEKKLVETQREEQRGRVLEAMQAQDEEHTIILRRRLEIDEELQARRIELDRQIEQLTAEGILAAGESHRRVVEYESALRADAERDYQQLVALGEAALLQAERLERRLRGEILAGSGGAEYLAIQAARSTHLQDVLLNANDPRVPNPLDVARMLELFQGGKTVP